MQMCKLKLKRKNKDRLEQRTNTINIILRIKNILTAQQRQSTKLRNVWLSQSLCPHCLTHHSLYSALPPLCVCVCGLVVVQKWDPAWLPIFSLQNEEMLLILMSSFVAASKGSGRPSVFAGWLNHLKFGSSSQGLAISYCSR